MATHRDGLLWRRQTASGSASSAIGMASATKVDIPLVIGLPMREEEAGEARRRHRRVKVEEPPHRTECEDGVAAEEGDAEEGTRSCASSPRRLERKCWRRLAQCTPGRRHAPTPPEKEKCMCDLPTG